METKAFGGTAMDTRVSRFARSLYFDVQSIEAVRPLEIWNGFREFDDPLEKSVLIKNLYKIAVPLANEHCLGRRFEWHSRCAKTAVTAVLGFFREDLEGRIFNRFPYPPTGDADEKELYRLVKAETHAFLPGPAEAAVRRDTSPGQTRAERLSKAVFPDDLFDFREMRIVDNELPYIIFTDKEYRVIHGIAIVYLWLIDLDAIFLETLSENGVDPEILEEYRQFCRRVHKENPLTIQGKKMDAHALLTHIQEKLKYDDYLDIFENVYAWFEQVKERLGF
jgi:hypothetical protein